MVILLIAVGAVFSLLFILNSIRRAAQCREKVGFFETLLAFLALVFPVLALVNNSASTQPLGLINMAAIAIGAAVAVLSIITLLIERNKPARRKLSQRRGVLGMGLGVLLVAATFVVPVAARFQLPGRTATNTASASSTGSNVNVADLGSVNSPTPTISKPITVVPTNTPDAALLQMSATPTRLASPSPTPTNTPYVIATATPGTVSTGEATQTSGQAAPAQTTSGCMAVVRQNVNLRSGPATTFDLLLTIPFSTTLDVSAKTKAGDWWFVTYQSKTGWVSGDFINLDSNCASLPVKAG